MNAQRYKILGKSDNGLVTESLGWLSKETVLDEAIRWWASGRYAKVEILPQVQLNGHWNNQPSIPFPPA